MNNRNAEKLKNQNKKEKTMDERSLILNAIKKKNKNTVPDPECPEPDVIEKWVKRKRRLDSWRQKECKDWNNADFLRYLDFMLKEFGTTRAKGNTRSDSDRLNHVYDRLAKHRQSKMSNLVLKDYLDWWCSIWASRLTGSEMYLTSLLQDAQITRFVSRYIEQAEEAQVLPILTQEVSDEHIYDLGGLDLLVMKRGIVIGYKMLRTRFVSDPAHQMRKTLSNLTKDALIGVMKTTIQKAPYPTSDKVDFVELAKPYLQNLGLVDMFKISHKRYFRSK
ncbi:MAG: hypothetical protein ACXAC5_00380 [Promethearchaeota archaeon]|jgi:hypothetical protein